MGRRHGTSALQRRTALIDAAIEVAAEKGLAGVTHRAVTEQAGLPIASVGYFFDSITDLAGEALRSKVSADTAALILLAQALAAEQRSPEEMLTAFADAARAPRTDALAFIEALLGAARQDALKQPVTEVLEAGRGAVVAATATVGTPVEDGSAFLALVHGFLLHALAAPDLVGPDDLPRALRTLLIGMLVEEGRVEDALALRA